MANYTQILYQLIFGTKHRKPTMTKENREILFRYMHGVLSKKKCFVYQINGIEDHLHIIFSLHPTVALSNLVKDLKLSAWVVIKEKSLFPNFSGWQICFSAFTYSVEAKENLMRYVENQEEHHKKKSYLDELIELYRMYGIEFDPKYLE